MPRRAAWAGARRKTATANEVQCVKGIVVSIMPMSGVEAALLVLAVAAGIAAGVFSVLWFRVRTAHGHAQTRFEVAERERRSLASLRQDTEARLSATRQGYQRLREQAKAKIAVLTASARTWEARYKRIAHWESIEDASAEAKRLSTELDQLKIAGTALRNMIEGYGNQYIVPPPSLLDELARETGHKAAGENLRRVREVSRDLARAGRGINCAETDSDRHRAIVRFLMNAYNTRVETVLSKVKTDNMGKLRQELNDVLHLFNSQSAVFSSATVSKEYHAARLDELKWASRVQQYRAVMHEEQRQLKVQMREEARVQREFEREQRKLKEQEATAQKAREQIEIARRVAIEEERARQEVRRREELERVTGQQRVELEARLQAEYDARVAQTMAEYSGKLESADARIRELEAAGERALSMAQQTKKGTVYIISNIGSFGEGIYKIGQTRRLNPEERIWELGDASVPFDFDVHALISSDDAPKLEYLLHEKFVLSQVNKVNWRKEFFRVSLAEIQTVVSEMGVAATWTMEAEARQFRESQVIEQQLRDDPNFRSQWLTDQLGVAATGGFGTVAEDSGAEEANETGEYQ
jgi:hypothetical protein